jgi:predicted nucleic acid-binding protein
LNYLLDTNVVSEQLKPRPDENVVRWIDASDEESLFLSVITFAEICKGIEDIGPGRRRDALAKWLYDDLPLRFERRILDVNTAVALAWGKIMSRSDVLGINLGATDAFFAATAEVYELTLVTRNVRDFTRLNIAILNPWDPAS